MAINKQESKTKRPKKGKKRVNALVLSGGGSRGAYQVGAWRALEELGWTFDIVVGVSVGSLNGAMVVQKERLLAENLWRDLETNHIFDVSPDAQTADFALEFLKQGGAGSKGLHHFVNSYIDDERVRESDIDFGLLVVEFPSMNPLYLWKSDIPKGQIGDYVMASSSAYPAIQVYEIDGKKYADGGYVNVLPIHMAVERGATDIVAIYLDAAGKFDRKAEMKSLGNAELTLVQAKWDLGNFLLFDKENTARIIRLGYLDTMKEFGVYDGNFYSFVKGDVDKRQLTGADYAAKIFELDPLILYSREGLLDRLSDAVSQSKVEFSDLLKAGRKAARSKGIEIKDIIIALRNLLEVHSQNSVLNAIDLKNIGLKNIDLRKAGETMATYNKKALTLIIAQDLKEQGENSIFLSRSVLRVFTEEVLAARFIEKNGLI